jgi:hypothetical protein
VELKGMSYDPFKQFKLSNDTTVSYTRVREEEIAGTGVRRIKNGPYTVNYINQMRS